VGAPVGGEANSLSVVGTSGRSGSHDFGDDTLEMFRGWLSLAKTGNWDALDAAMNEHPVAPPQRRAQIRLVPPPPPDDE